MSDDNKAELLTLTTRITAAVVRGQPMAASALPDLLQLVYSTLAQLQHSGAPPVERQRPAPAVPINRSVTTDTITCLECGKKGRTLKRHLGSEHNLTPDAYRTKWGLPHDYPMAAPSYAAARSALAKSLGLGRVGRGRPRAKNTGTPQDA
ncbi:MucR family transcriptional regulator [Azospirillum sp. A1-3]|uniref:MucR family transcriptional regulator n=1 Tax=Azospirillum sp. A1-3 TaxID=185874 RepID=UPI002076F7DF|nr:MucR family transcriptional regulator [Azospirillum sp. A1-3]MCM8738519.1 MucR family transcriptional regulator [Azospirillum sp. A1-3]